jgi:uncharacterized protein YukE
MEQKYISFKEFAEYAGVTVQSLYKRLKKETDELQPFYKKIDGKSCLCVSALMAVYKKEYQPKEEKEAKAEEQTNNKLIDILQEQLEAQRKDIEAKNKTIESLLQQLDTQQQLLCQEQQLNMINTQKILMLESAAAETPIEAEAADLTIEEETPIEAEAAEKPKKKRGFFGLFSKRSD